MSLALTGIGILLGYWDEIVHLFCVLLKVGKPNLLVSWYHLGNSRQHWQVVFQRRDVGAPGIRTQAHLNEQQATAIASRANYMT